MNIDSMENSCKRLNQLFYHTTSNIKVTSHNNDNNINNYDADKNHRCTNEKQLKMDKIVDKNNNNNNNNNNSKSGS